jgi:curved DNA-binding protein CbpA
MSADGSAYAALGLEPGADAAAIEQAYKRLIKQFHPDREGGDAKRAAEINRAYRELRLAGQVKEALDLQHWDEGSGGAQVRIAVLLLGIAGALTLVTAPMLFLGSAPAITTPQRAVAARDDHDAMDQPIATQQVDSAIAEARRLSAASDEMRLADTSRDCHRQLRNHPTIAGLDRCAAFDDAVAQLQDRDPLRDRGPFSELAVTGRKMSSATLLSDDYLAIDSRLDQIRLRVELALAPAPPLAAN